MQWHRWFRTNPKRRIGLPLEVGLVASRLRIAANDGLQFTLRFASQATGCSGHHDSLAALPVHLFGYGSMRTLFGTIAVEGSRCAARPVASPPRPWAAPLFSTLARKAPSPSPAPATRKSTATSLPPSDDDDDDPAGSVPVRPQKVRILTETLNLKHLAIGVRDKSINLQPGYQRNFVWDQPRCMGLLKTVFEGLPVPAIMLHQKQNKQGQWREVVDGKQRLVTLYAFVTGDNSSFPGAPTTIDLPDDDELAPLLNGKSFADLEPRDQSALEGFVLQVQVIPEDTEQSVVYRVYENVNAGGVSHSAMQLRRAVFQGSYIALLDTLAHPGCPEDRGAPAARRPPGSLLRDLAEFTEEEADTQLPEELVLRFFALRAAALQLDTRRPFPRSIKHLLNEELQVRHPDTGRKVTRELGPGEEGAMGEKFTATIRAVHSLGLKAAAEEVLRASGSKLRSFRKAGSTTGAGPLWDTTLVGVSKMLDSGLSVIHLERHAASLLAGYRQLLRDPEWTRLPSTLTRKTLAARLELFGRLVAERVPQKDPRRGFPRSAREALWAASPAPRLCAWCGGEITRAEHAEVDHVVAHSAGGRTELGNAQLLHAHCNRQRGARPMPPSP